MLNKTLEAHTIARLSVNNLTIHFGTFAACRRVSFAVRAGSICALLGENGAGKSTLVKMIYGLLAPDEGAIALDDAPLVDVAQKRFLTPKQARARGIGMVFQHFCLFEALSVFDNIALGLDAVPKRAELSARIDGVMRAYCLPLSLKRPVHTLSMGERQRVEIVRVLLQNPRLLIMDEPTSVLTPQEAQGLFATLRLLAAQGCAILYISHKLHEIATLCDEAIVLRTGEVVGSCDPRTTPLSALATMMMGEGQHKGQGTGQPKGRPEWQSNTRAEALAKAPARQPLLEARALCLPQARLHDVALVDVSFSLHSGEIFGIAGIAGNGQSELFCALSGERLLPEPAMLLFSERAIGAYPIEARRKMGLAFVPEERLGHGGVPELSLVRNTLLTARARQNLERRGFLDMGRAARFTGDIVRHFEVKTRGGTAGEKHPETIAARKLSGGNLQKYIMGRELLQAPKLIIINQPTWGVDIAAAQKIHDALVRLKSAGTAIVLISQDLDELFALCDSIAVLNRGHLSTPQDAGTLSPGTIGRLMGGAIKAQEMPGIPLSSSASILGLAP